MAKWYRTPKSAGVPPIVPPGAVDCLYCGGVAVWSELWSQDADGTVLFDYQHAHCPNHMFLRYASDGHMTLHGSLPRNVKGGAK